MDESPARKLPDPGSNGPSASSPPIPPSVDLVIRFHPVTQNVEVVGPVDQRILCYGMLEMARVIIDGLYLKREFAESQPRILPASGPLPPFPRL